MIYLYIGKNSIKLLSLSKTLLGQFSVSFFEKTHTTILLDDGDIKNVDIVASAVKEALTSARPAPVKDDNVYLVLPQESFLFARYEIPTDIQQSAIVPFVKDKARADFPFDVETSYFDFFVMSQRTESVVLFFTQKQEVYQKFAEALSLLGLSVKAVVPETMCYYKLFEKTLKKDKKEKILYTSYSENGSWGYLYDSLGLLQHDAFQFTDPIEKSIKDKTGKLKEEGKIDRVILAGDKSKTVRQDVFTKDVGIWTNPLDKIVTNFYQDYLKMIVLSDKTLLPFLSLEVCLGAFILHHENPNFSLLKNKSSNGVATSTPAKRQSMRIPRLPINLRDVIVFIIAALITVSLITFGQQFGFKLPGKPAQTRKAIPTVQPETMSPTSKPTPTPSFSKEELKIKILNGSGTKGKAGDVQDILKEKGYVDILTGNADSFDYATTEIQVKDSVKEASIVLKKDLADNVKNIKVGKLDEKDNADIIIIVGTDFK
jgi:hypothetical protein